MKASFILFLSILVAFFNFLYIDYARPENVLDVDTILSIPKIFSQSGDIISIQGRWKKISGTSEIPKVSRINTTNITCNKKTMYCYEIIADLATPKEHTLLKKPFLFIQDTAYKIIDWSNGIIRAKHSALVADFVLTISIKEEFAERKWRETKARGSKTSDPNNYELWTLE